MAHRIDPMTYHPDRQLALLQISKMPFEIKHLYEIVSFLRLEEQGDAYIGLENVSSHTGVLLDSGISDEMAGGVGFIEDTVLFPKLRPYLNKVWRATFAGTASTEFHVLQSKSGLLPDYLAILLRSSFILRQTSRLMTGATLPRLQTEDIKRLSVPVPDTKFQNKLIEIWTAANQKSQEMKERAIALLAGIDDYLLGELGIVLPDKVENTTDNRIFKTTRRELADWRFDARVHRSVFQLSTTRYPNSPLKNLVHINARTDFKKIEDSTLLTFVPMEAISDVDGTISWPQERPFSDNTGYTSFQEGDLLWAKITPCMENGKSAVARRLLNGYGFGSTEYHVLRPRNEDVSVDYLHALFRMRVVRCAAQNYFGGSSGHQRVDEAFFHRLSIPLPALKIQQRLAANIDSMREDAKRLRREAEVELETAKRRIEALLLGASA